LFLIVLSGIPKKYKFEILVKRVLFHYLSYFRENVIDFLHLFCDKRLTVFSLF